MSLPTAAEAARLAAAGRFTDAELAYQALLALSAANDSGGDPALGAERGQLLVGLAEVYWRSGQRARAYEQFRVALPLLALGDTEQRARVHLRVGQVLMDSPLNRPQAIEHLVAALQLGGEAFVAKEGSVEALDLAKVVVPPPQEGWSIPIAPIAVRTIDDPYLAHTVRAMPQWHTPRIVRDWQIQLLDAPDRPMRIIMDRGKKQLVCVQGPNGEPIDVHVPGGWAGPAAETRFRHRDHDFILRVDGSSTVAAAFGRVAIELFCDGRSCDRGVPYAASTVSGGRRAAHIALAVLVLLPLFVVPVVVLVILFFSVFPTSTIAGIIIGGVLGATIGALIERTYLKMVSPPRFLRYYVPAILVMEPPPPWSPSETNGAPPPSTSDANGAQPPPPAFGSTSYSYSASDANGAQPPPPAFTSTSHSASDLEAGGERVPLLH